jgi:isopropylmalate/homocitrate/citramalate synthase
MVLGKHSGKHAFEDRLKELGFHLDAEKIKELFEKLKVLADKKKTVSDRATSRPWPSGRTPSPPSTTSWTAS